MVPHRNVLGGSMPLEFRCVVCGLAGRADPSRIDDDISPVTQPRRIDSSRRSRRGNCPARGGTAASAPFPATPHAAGLLIHCRNDSAAACKSRWGVHRRGCPFLEISSTASFESAVTPSRLMTRRGHKPMSANRTAQSGGAGDTRDSLRYTVGRIWGEVSKVSTNAVIGQATFDHT